MPDRPLVRRRTALGGLAAVALLTACDNGDDIVPAPDSRGSASPSLSTGTPTATEDPPSPDQALVDEVLTGLTTALAVLGQARRTREIRAQFTPLIRAHRRHVEVLEGELTHEPHAGPALAPAAALRLVRRQEHELHTTLVEAAGQAESGSLAMLLASMSASVSQHLTALPSGAAS
ncbi:MAG TPA: fimbrillin family protein [Nocardioides sp.]|uniref:fimbrillin family protein n=1 Tax=uncultured Nocardioides sp. TaxID=198441 RepID=UPI00261CADEA|nr:fimbrillin family protein [uncultured Nocardioides sp.]HRD61078.1 fimbrillin family protein [Nocardioides sp.]HRI95827.1 fimbrillin family protein [Nocardioides sp.]HRK45661.1 fimbrillin family protein [Nocardioides sp.]